MKIFKIIKEKPLYQDLMTFLKNEKSIISISKLERKSMVRESKIKAEDRNNCAMILLKKMVNVIGVVDKIDNPDAVLKALKEFID